MSVSPRLEPRFQPRFQPLPELREAWQEQALGDRHRKLVKAAEAARERFISSGQVLGLATCPIATFPYPSLYAFQGAALSPAPYVMMTNRMMVVQFDEDGERKTLLFNPTDDERAEKAPFYTKLKQRYGNALAEKVLSKRHGKVAEHLSRLGLGPEDVDYIAFDHLHLQDVRGWLGSYSEAALFPAAKLLVMRAEWREAKDPHPMQKPWYIAGGIDGIDEEERVIFLDGDTLLGPGAAILDTRGHTLGNMSLAVHGDDGVFVTSENGVAAECYTPEASEIRGLARYAKNLDQEVILNGNTRDSTPDQYASMVVEKTFAGPNAARPEYVNFYPSSELTSSVIAPGLSPSFTHGELKSGQLQPKG